MMREFDCLVENREVISSAFVAFLDGRRFAYSRAAVGATLVQEGRVRWSDRFNSLSCFTQVANPETQEVTRSGLYLQFNNPNNSTDNAWDRLEIDDECLSVYSAEGDLRWSLKLIKE